MKPSRWKAALAAVLCLVSLWTAYSAAPDKADAITADNARYYGPLKSGRLHGRGRLEWANGGRYEGEFADGLMAGRGQMRFANGEHYDGEFRDGMMWGRGRMQTRDGSIYLGDFRADYYDGTGRLQLAGGDVYEGVFEKGEFKSGTHTRKDGSRSEGTFAKWRLHGRGKYVDESGTAYEGQFVEGELNGKGSLVAKQGVRYDGEFKDWRFHGQGVLRLPNGDEYRGGFAHGSYEGEGTLKYGKPRDGRSEEKGRWRYGRLEDDSERQRSLRNVEVALYAQRPLLDAALRSLAPRESGKVNLYLLAIGGDGSQEVFRREVEFVRAQFDRDFGTAGRSLALVNSRTTVDTVPMATQTSIRESLQAIASRMDKQQDILFLFLTSHGSKEHEFTLNQNNMTLRGLQARQLADLLKESGIRWKVVVVSACYAGGFIDHLKDEQTLVVTAARHDRRSFGCSDDNDFTYFGRAFFQEALPKAGSFQDAFARAQTLVKEWELKDFQTAPKGDQEHSLPQIHDPAPIQGQLRRWWAERGRKAR